MKLRKVKLSGFKSFVDPTTVDLQSNLTGVVGPNGCGKSNLIDAVRWVMGEISAKQLRGEAMSDVIFNGSATRKPVGQAVAELVFDNSDASLGGEYAKYHEISIKRAVSRDGASDYFLNSASCRRKDITNIFLGTGLGPNSYAVIEQGMISRFIEAKPEELRVFIEEAAGISKYKERRRETENRIKHTKENLFRLNDILEEINKQLKHLKSQANAAERYHKLKQEERLAKAELYALSWRELDKKRQEQEILIKKEELTLENRITDLHTLDANLAKLREQYSGDIEEFNKAQENFYRLGIEITRLEQQIKHTKERQEELTRTLTQIDLAWQETKTTQMTDQEQFEALQAEKLTLETKVTELQERLIHTRQAAQLAENELQLWQKNWDEFNHSNAQALQLLEVTEINVQHLEQRVTTEVKSLEKFNTELAGLNFPHLTSEIDTLIATFTELKQHHDKLHAEVATKQQQILAQREAGNKLASILDQTRNKLQNLIGRHSSLQALQQAALGKNDATLSAWLKQHHLDQKLRLAQALQVAAGWETAVETVLGVYLEAVCVEGIASIAPTVRELTQGSLTLFDQTVAMPVAARLELPTLASKVHSNQPLGSLLSGIYVAESMAEALTRQSWLNQDESIITKDGLWLGAGWLRVIYDANPKLGILQRERELQELERHIGEEQQNCMVQERQLAEQQHLLTMVEEEHQQAQSELHLLVAQYSEIQSQIAAKKTHLQHLKERALFIEQESLTHEKNLQQLREQLALALDNRETTTKKQTANEAWRQNLIEERNLKEQTVATSRHHLATEEQTLAEAKLRLQLLQTQMDYLSQNLERANKRLTSLIEQRANSDAALAEARAPLVTWEQALQLELEKRLGAETALTLAKQKIAGVEQELRELEQRRADYQEANEALRLLLEKARTECQGLQVRGTTYSEQVAELGFQLEDLHASLPEGATLTAGEEKLAQLTLKIERLGLINLAAIEEFEKLQERKNYLDTQNQDLVSALNILEDVIRKIDADTKERFKDAYNNINHKFQELFPKIFNGGKASLEQTADNLLETGVVVMAQPPGKRNSSIHLLSGGEKTLTAIALIFSIFHLNPAPFCMLDEVDAPLDDINVLRFCNLVKEMAQTVQFIFITHNKLTMETSEQLIGVTMQEPGVSRLVTVDIDTAISLAEK